MSNLTFEGFPQEGLQFLADLAENNSREWFKANEIRFKKELQAPAVAFVATMGERLQRLVPEIRYDTRTNGAGSLMRIYRDTRFSKDKTPYKTNISGMWWQGEGKKTVNPAFGFQFNTAGMGLMAGMFGFDKVQLNAYREAVADEDLGTELQAIVDTLTQNGRYELLGSHYKRVPRGYASDHPRKTLLLHNALYAHPTTTIEPQQLTSPTLIDICLAHFETMLPVLQWLVKMQETADR